MAITDVVILYEDAIEEAKAERGSVRRSATRVLLAKTNTKNPSFTDIATNTNAWPGLDNGKIPQINDEHMFGAYKLYVRGRKFTWYEGIEYGVQIDVSYEGKDEEYDDGSKSDSPSSAAETWRRITITSSQVTVPASESQDIDGEATKPIVNSAGDPVDGIEEETALAVMTYTNNYAVSPNLPKFYDYINKTNQQTFLGAEQRTLRFTGFSAEFDDATQLWRVSVELTYNPKKWRVPYYDAGYNELVGGERRAILDSRGNPVSQPVPLENTGEAKAPGAAPGILYAYPYEEKDFNNMLSDLRI